MFRVIAQEIASLVKKYQGSLSGEHGDGRLRGEFIPQIIGKENYELLRQIKHQWDPEGIFNPGKIVDSPPMDQHLRYEKNQQTPEYETAFDFSREKGILRAAEMCNGSGDCRKSEWTGGTMCPSYMATRDEKDSTRARANVLREYLTRSHRSNPFDQPEIGEAMDLCLSCKGCKKECPSNVDMAKLKAEWQYQQYKSKKPGIRTRMIAGYGKTMAQLEKVPWLFNGSHNWIKPVMGFAPKRSMPRMATKSLRQWFNQDFEGRTETTKGRVYFFFDEFTNYLDVEIGQKAISLLDRLGYHVIAIPHVQSGRSYISKGFLDEVRGLAKENVSLFHKALMEKPGAVVGVEPSAILTFRDEYPDLLRAEDQDRAHELAAHCFTMEEFLARELEAGNIKGEDFRPGNKKIWVHGHCHQKALIGMVPTKKILQAAGHHTMILPTGCCGMAGSFGYEKAHYEISMKIGELVLFPKIREADDQVLILASGTSGRHQIWDGTGKRAYHPVEVL
jgi:Fe-S oxidoreductase